MQQEKHQWECADARVSHGLDAVELANLELFKGANAHSVEAIVRGCPVRECAPGEMILDTGALHEQLYLVLSGRVAAYTGSGTLVYEVEAGGCAGETGVLEGALSQHSLISLTESRLLVLDEESFLTLINSSHAIACNFILALTQRLRRHAEPAEHKQLQREYQRLASVDYQTGLFSRRWLEEQLARYINRSAMSNEALSLIMVSIDGMSLLAHTAGAEAREAVVRNLAATMEENVRPIDLIARYGHDQFVVVLPDTNLKGARIAAERLRKAIANARLSAGPGLTLPRVTASIGLAQLESFVSTDALLSAAQGAAARAAESGGNCIAA